MSRRECEQILAQGAAFATLYVHREGDGAAVRRVFADAHGGFEVVSAPVESGRAASIIDIAPAAAWDEREARDIYNVTFAGHDPHRPLVRHDCALDDWTVPVHGHDAYQVAVGPIHAGIIESGHFRFHVVGERVLHLDTQLMYNHRGIEQLVEGRTVEQAMHIVGRTCAGCHVANSVVFAHACESALGLYPSPELARARTQLLELDRAWNHCNDIAAICAGVGFALGNMAFASLKERTQRMCQLLTGHRFLFDSVSVGSSTLDPSEDQLGILRSELASIQIAARRAWREIQASPSVHDRCHEIGVLDAGVALAMGAVGPAARASGVPDDVRTHSPRLAYDGFTSATPTVARGDVATRLEMRAIELDASLSMLERLLTQEIKPAACTPSTAGHGVGQVESPRGATTCVVELGAGDADALVQRMRLRTSSYANWPVVAATAPGNLLPDFPLINKSFELCYACCDR
jgi:Ni,Fe-hydrogenase III large subunit